MHIYHWVTKMKKYLKLLLLLLMLSLGGLLIVKPQICQKNVAEAIIICGKILIPSLFPFGVCMLYILNSGILGFQSSKFSPILIVILFFSLIGGYPMGSKLINEAVKNGCISPKDGRKMLNYCVNGGPAFIMSAVGCGLLSSKKAGYILLLSHILASIIIFSFSGKISIKNTSPKQRLSPADNFVLSASESASAIISICGFVILFSVITGYIDYFSDFYPILRPLIFLTEVTTAVTKTKNIILISFLLGFSGLCVWCQVLSVGKNIGINIVSFAAFRFLHGILSSFFTFILLKIFPITLQVFSNGVEFTAKPYVSSEVLGISLLVMASVFIISLCSRDKNTKILEEII